MDYKYANLPGIAKNEPDFYETPNPPATAAQNSSTGGGSEKLVDWQADESASIQKIIISQAECHQKFNPGFLNNHYTDFSDTITNLRKIGYISEPDKFEWNQDIVESPYLRYRRLESELADLAIDLNEQTKRAKEQKSTDLDFDPIKLTELVESLQKKVNSLHLQSIGANVNDSLLDAKSKQLLIDQLNDFKANVKKTSSNEANSLVFKLFTDLDQNDIDKLNKISEMNKRISNLENIFGAGNNSFINNNQQIAKLCSNIENKTIIGLIENLNSKMNLVDSQSLDQIESRLQLLTQRINSLNEKKTSSSSSAAATAIIEDQEKINKINELYAMLTNLRDASTTIPSIIERMASLNQLHQKAFQFSNMLSRIDQEQQQIKKTQDMNIETLSQLKSSLESNLESIKSSFQVLNERIDQQNNKK